MRLKRSEQLFFKILVVDIIIDAVRVRKIILGKICKNILDVRHNFD